MKPKIGENFPFGKMATINGNASKYLIFIIPQKPHEVKAFRNLIWQSLKKLSSGGNDGKYEIFYVRKIMLIISKLAVSRYFAERII